MGNGCLVDWIILGSKIFWGERGGGEIIVIVNKFPSLTCQILTHLYKDRENQTNKEAFNTTRKQQQSQVKWRLKIVLAKVGLSPPRLALLSAGQSKCKM